VGVTSRPDIVENGRMDDDDPRPPDDPRGPDTVTSAQEPVTGEPKRPVRRRTWWILLAVAAIVAAVVVGIALVNGGNDDEAAPEALTTATVELTDLVATETLSGTLGYGAAEPLTFRSSADGVVTVIGLASGFVTDIVQEGEIVVSGDVLYDVNTRPVVVLEGDVPAYRAFSNRMSDGPDVEQLERALVDLGYDPGGRISVDEDFTSATADAIELLQGAIGAEETGQLALGDVIFAPTSASFVAEVLVDIADQVAPGTPIIATSAPVGGTVTSIADEGSVIGRGEVLLTIDQEPVILLIGAIPAYRTMTAGVEGDDVAQLEQNLADLGFDDVEGFVVDGDYDTATTLAVAAWQAATGASPDGVVNLGDVHVSPTPVRISETLVRPGDAVGNGTPILRSSVSSTFVTVELSTDDQDLVAVGEAVVVVLPDGSREAAVVTDIGSVVLATQQGDTYFEMTVTLEDPDAAQGLDEAPVDVEVIGDRADDVLVVPVTALVALAEGGYAVEVAQADGSTSLVAVDPGLFADGFVEVTSSGLEPGMEVVVP
jgi:peptidoglycan hydrolase-like protein with peptidoglycan-binding domain